MIILPAIDIRGGQCVRLYKGDFATAEKVAEDPIATAQSFAEAGAAWLHTVDLDGAVEGRPVNKAVFEQIVRRHARSRWRSAAVSAIWIPSRLIWTLVSVG